MGKRDIVDIIPEFKPGDAMPEGYIAFQDWAAVQHRAGLRQVRRTCGKFHFPQEVCSHE